MSTHNIFHYYFDNKSQFPSPRGGKHARACRDIEIYFPLLNVNSRGTRVQRHHNLKTIWLNIRSHKQYFRPYSPEGSNKEDFNKY